MQATCILCCFGIKIILHLTTQQFNVARLAKESNFFVGINKNIFTIAVYLAVELVAFTRSDMKRGTFECS